MVEPTDIECKPDRSADGDSQPRSERDVQPMLPETAKVIVLVARPVDETLWAGGTLLLHDGWTSFVGTLCGAGDETRAPNFYRALDRLGAQGAMADLDDGPAQNPLGTKLVHSTLRSLVSERQADLVITHAPPGASTRTLRHEEVSRAVLEMWACGELHSRELWLFACEGEAAARVPRVEASAEIQVDLPDAVWDLKQCVLTEVYGLAPDSWELRATPRRETFWRLTNRDHARTWI